MIKNKKLLSAVLSAILALSTITVPAGKFGTANAKASNGKNSVFCTESKEEIANKIDKKLLIDFKTSTSKVSFLVKLKDQVDTNLVVKSAETKAKKQSLTAYKTDLLKKSSIVSSLSIKADTTQRSIKTYLDIQKKKGNVTKYTSFYIVNGLAVTATKDVMNKLAAMQEVESIVEDGKVKLIDNSESSAATSSKKISTMSSSNIGSDLVQIGAPSAWALGIDGTGIVIGSLDSGVMWNHPALQRKYRGYNPADPSVPDNECNWFDATDEAKTSPYDGAGHGTHTVGTMLGSCADGTNQIGVAPGAKWIAARAIGSDGSGTDSAMLAAGQWLLAPVDKEGNKHPELAPNIINNSWGADGNTQDDWFNQVISSWKAAGILPVFSAGNDGQNGEGTLGNPGNTPDAFTVAAVDSDNNLADFSSRGPSPYGVQKPNISAPGVQIRSSYNDGGYTAMDGTSMAAPHVSGTAALIMQANPKLTVDQIEDIITKTATARTDSDYTTVPNNGYGYGVINAFKAVASVLPNGVGTVTGQVLKDGQDTAAPTWKEEFVNQDQAMAGIDLPLTINAQDDVEVKSVELQYSLDGTNWTKITAERVSGDYKSGDYSATIPAEDVTVKGFEYRWRIVDFGENEVMTDTHKITTFSSITDGYSTDFEDYPSGWTSYGSNLSTETGITWQRGIPTAGIGRAASGQKVYAIGLTGGYDAHTDTNLEMPVIDLPQGASYLQFKEWHRIGQWDEAYVEVSTDNTNWTTLTTYTGSSNKNYTSVQIDLSAYAGKRIYIKFELQSTWIKDDGIGWFIDDVSLSSQTLTAQARANRTLKEAEKENTAANSQNTLQQAAVSGLPLSGSVTALELGSSANTNPADGSYNLTLPAGEFTIQAEAYGYHSSSQKVTITKDTVTDKTNFTLQPLSKGTLTGKITNSVTGKPIADAKLYLIEDASVAPVYTDSEGNYTITAYEGDYTVQVTAADYYSQSFSTVIKPDEAASYDAKLKPFIEYSGGLISYDDGTMEGFLASNVSGMGIGVKMTLPDGQNYGILKTALFSFANKNTGTDFKVAVFDSSGKMISGPYDAEAVLDSNVWTKVDLSSYKIMVPHDFYLFEIQNRSTNDTPSCPFIGRDTTGADAGRSYSYEDGTISQLSGYGNLGIRAVVDYDAQAPVITAPMCNSFTNSSTITVTGKAAPELDLHIFNNNKEAAVVKPDDNGSFSAQISLEQGTNELKAYTDSSIGIGHTDYSDTVTINLDNTAPVLNIKSPADNYKTNKQDVTIQGTVTEANLENIIVNGTTAQINADDTWSARIALNAGVNTVEAVATDKAGNKAEQTIKIDTKNSIKDITNLTPDKDICLTTGKSVKVEFDSEPGLKKAVFTINMPLEVNSTKGIRSSSITEFPMSETVDQNGNGTGHYTGYYTIPSALTANGAQIEIKAEDWYGNILTEYAAGKLYINSGEKINVNRIAGINRYETSEKIAEAYGNGQKVDNVILTSGADFPDALSGAVLTTPLKASILLVGSDENNTEAYNYIKNYLADSGKVYILGGTGAVSQNTEDYVSKTLKKTVVRISGQDRFETNRKIIDTLNPSKGTPVIITSSGSFADALSVSSVSAIKGYPIVLVNGKHLSESALSVVKNIQPSSVYVIGGTGAVDNNIITEIKDADTGINDVDIIRIGGADRYETSLKVLKQFNMNKGNLVVAAGSCFADGLSGAALAAKESAPVLITDSSALNSQLSTMLKYTNITVAGGYGAVTADVENCLNGKSALPAYIETSIALSAAVASKIVLPGTVTGYYADGVKLSMPVIWDKNASLDTSKACTLTIIGTVEGYDTPVTLTVTVK